MKGVSILAHEDSTIILVYNSSESDSVPKSSDSLTTVTVLAGEASHGCFSP